MDNRLLRNTVRLEKVLPRFVRLTRRNVSSVKGSSPSRGSDINRRRRRRRINVNQQHIQNQESKVLDDKIRELQKLAQNLKIQISTKKEKQVESEFKNLDKPITDDELDDIVSEILDAPKPNTLLLTDDIHNNNNNNKGLKLFDEPARGIQFSKPIIERIGISIQNVLSNENLKWDNLIVDLYENKNGFDGLENKDVYQFLRQIPSNFKLSPSSIEKIEKMIENRKTSSAATINEEILMNLYANVENVEKVESLYQSLLLNQKQLNPPVFSSLIKVYVKSKNLTKINEILLKMKELKLEPSLFNYTNILSLCVRLQDSKQAEQIFRMMKFRSLETRPDILAYNNMIQLQIKKKNVYKAIDYYQELLDEGLKPNTYTFNALALACSKDKKFISKGWYYISEINKRNLDPNLTTFETMLRLSARDGDLELARALYLKISEIKPDISNDQNITAGNESLNYLMMAYRDYKPNHKPQSILSKEISIIRRNTIQMVDFIGLHQNLIKDNGIIKKRENLPPFLPLKTIFMKDQIISEAKAIWSFNVVKNPNCLTYNNLITFLRIFVEQNGDKHDFLQNFEQYTYPNKEVETQLKKKSVDNSIDTNEILRAELENYQVETQQESLVSIENLPPVLKYVKSFNHKIERESSLYYTLLSSGKRFNDFKICENAWKERGLYRKSSKYLSFPLKIRKELDFKFAIEMVNTLINFNQLDLAYNVVKSSEDSFPWNFYVLKPLYVALKDNGYYDLSQDLSNICDIRKHIPL
ncbi:hypothetical protein WICMUC_005788 [Wickerhamomyces mucosus]|uniref:Mitochondrial group I intron splicing factor CCM1 n=1 Tax=Wickerhamomyces mucosus TaxID=1378264 RepID=A0A9P8P239_9ASCO|nr:hypothetical protein WICMUC_005788 [Wickerhamomyces mucosus]